MYWMICCFYSQRGRSVEPTVESEVEILVLNSHLSLDFLHDKFGNGSKSNRDICWGIGLPTILQITVLFIFRILLKERLTVIYWWQEYHSNFSHIFHNEMHGKVSIWSPPC